LAPAEATVSEPSRTAWPLWQAGQRRAGLLALAAVLALLPLALPNSYFYDIAIAVALNATVCVGLNLLIGYAGQISLGHAAFFALGGYGSAILSAQHGWPSWLAMLAVCAAVGLLAFIVGRPTLRLKGHYLAMATLGLGVIVSIVLATEDRVTGGPDGMAVPPLAFFGWAVRGEHAWYALSAGSLLLAVWLALNLVDSPVGRALRALHGSEIAAQTLGIAAAGYKLRVFVISAVFAAVAGALTAHHAGFITPSQASFMHSVELVIMVVFGGMASIFGAVVGAAILTTLPQWLAFLKDYEMMVFGAVLMATMVFFPRGVVPTLAHWLRRWRP
jgi:branched-chain amino acid transport system permease protein